MSTISTNQSDKSQFGEPSPGKSRSEVRRRSRSRSRSRNRDRKRRRYSSSIASSVERDGFKSRRFSPIREKNTRRRFSSHSPIERGRRKSRSVDSDPQRRSASVQSSKNGFSRGDSFVAQNRDRTRGDRSHRERSPVRMDSRDRGNRREKQEGLKSQRRTSPSRRENRKAAPPAFRERSLSPYSKRLALTQAMNMGKG